MLADSLGKHPHLYVHRFEVRVLPYFLQRQGRFGDLGTLAARRRLARDLGKSKAIWQVNAKEDLILSDAQLSEPGFAGVVGAIFTEFASREGKARWGEKSPTNLLHISELAASFPESQFIHIIRDGRECAQSFHRRFGYEPRHTILRWKRMIAAGREQGLRIGSKRYMEVRYEEVTRSPDSEMRRICAFLDLPFSSVVVESSMRMVDAHRASEYNRIIENSDKWRTYFTKAQIVTLERIAGSCLAANGYIVDNSQGDENPSRFITRWWATRGRVIETANHFKRWGWRGFPAFLRMVSVAAKQIRAGKI